ELDWRFRQIASLVQIEFSIEKQTLLCREEVFDRASVAFVAQKFLSLYWGDEFSMICKFNPICWPIRPVRPFDANERRIGRRSSCRKAIYTVVIDKMKDDVSRLDLNHCLINSTTSIGGLWRPQCTTERILIFVAIRSPVINLFFDPEPRCATYWPPAFCQSIHSALTILPVLKD